MRERRIILMIMGVLLFSTVLYAIEEAEDEPYGPMSENSLDRFLALAQSHGVDIYAEMEKAYKGDGDALSNVLGLSVHFDKMDKITRVYGNLVFTSFLNLVEDRGEEFFVNSIEVHPAGVQQKIRDFVYFAVMRVPQQHKEEVEKETREHFRRMFPAGYVFGQGNALFR